MATIVYSSRWGRYTPDWGPEYARAATFEVVGGRVWNRKTGTTPVFLHGNGRDEMTWIPGGEG